MLDAEATSFLMMGSLSPGMKKHSVTLFEGGAPFFTICTAQANLVTLAEQERNNLPSYSTAVRTAGCKALC